MRTKNSIRNIVITMAGQIIMLLFKFACRTIFKNMLGEVYLGVSTVFTDVLSVLSLADLGFGSAIIYSMYKPLVENDEYKIKALMNLYRKAYLIVASAISVVSLGLIPFLDILVKGKNQVNDLVLIYLLYVANTVITYLYSYKQSIIIADQRTYVVNGYQFVLISIQKILQIVVLLVTRNFILYLLVQLVTNFMFNFIISKKADRMYPYLKEKNKEKLDDPTKKTIFRNIRAMFFHRAGDVVLNATDTVIMSAFTGIVNAGLYGNYKMIIRAVMDILAQVFSSITASVGNMGAMDQKERLHNTYLSINFVGFWIFGFCAICFFVLLNPFVTIWMGEDSLFSVGTVLLLCINFYMTGMRRSTLVFRDALGLFWYDRYKSIAECLVNLVASIILVQVIGITGIFVGTFISTACVSAWIEPYILYKYGLKRKGTEYVQRYFIYTGVMLLAGFVTWWIAGQLAPGGFLGILVRLVICVIIPNVIFLIAFGRTKEFSYFWKIIVGMIEKARKK